MRDNLKTILLFLLATLSLLAAPIMFILKVHNYHERRDRYDSNLAREWVDFGVTLWGMITLFWFIIFFLIWGYFLVGM